MSIVRQQKWKKVEYSRSKIIKAGKTIRKAGSTEEQLEEATKVIDNWRAAHAFPLHVIYIHLRGMASGKNIVVAERLKRLDSIIKKLANSSGFFPHNGAPLSMIFAITSALCSMIFILL